ALEDGRFRTAYVESEKHTVQKKLEAIVNDKGRYAAERCIEEMCKDEPYRLHPLGRKEDLEQITADSLYDSYKQWLAKAPIDIYVVGNTTLAEVKKQVEHAFAIRGEDSPTPYTSSRSPKQVKDINTVVERMDVGQG